MTFYQEMAAQCLKRPHAPGGSSNKHKDSTEPTSVAQSTELKNARSAQMQTQARAKQRLFQVFHRPPPTQTSGLKLRQNLYRIFLQLAGIPSIDVRFLPPRNPLTKALGCKYFE